MTATDRTMELVQALSNNPWVDNPVRSIAANLLAQWRDEDVKADDDDTAPPTDLAQLAHRCLTAFSTSDSYRTKVTKIASELEKTLEVLLEARLRPAHELMAKQSQSVAVLVAALKQWHEYDCAKCGACGDDYENCNVPKCPVLQTTAALKLVERA